MTWGVNQGVILLLVFLIFCSILNGKIYAQTKVSYDGYIAMDARYEHGEKYAELYTKMKLEIKLDLTQYIKTEIDIRGNSNDPDIELKEVHALLKYDPKCRIKVGNIKKCFGIEELISQEDLYTIEEGQITKYISPFGYVGRDPGIQVYRKYKGEGSPYSYYLGASCNQSANAALNGRISYHSLFGSWCIGFDGVYQRSSHRPEKEYPPNIYAMSIDLSWHTGSLYTDLEAFWGQDPIETQLNEFRGDNKDVLFSAVKWLLAYHWDTNKTVVKGVEPLFLSSILVPDTKYMAANRIELLLGVNIYLDKDVRLRLNGDLILSTNKYNTHDRTVAAGSKIVSELQLKW